MQTSSRFRLALSFISMFMLTPVTGLSAEESYRQAEVAERGAHVMPFNLAKTQHQFSKTPTGGVQRVIARNPADAEQIGLIRQHLQQLAQHFRSGDFSGPASIHGSAMPGLGDMAHAKPGALQIEYAEETAGATLTFTGHNPDMINAVHSYFNAQLRDHGHDALEVK
ncbi:MAG: aspartate carbamoyltransferase [Methylomonas sp.]|jgi:hypothetical protein